MLRKDDSSSWMVYDIRLKRVEDIFIHLRSSFIRSEVFMYERLHRFKNINLNHSYFLSHLSGRSLCH